MAKYSVLSSDAKFLSDQHQIDALLSKGVKIIAFCDDETEVKLHQGHSAYLDARLLQTYVLSDEAPVLTIHDGVRNDTERDLLKTLASSDNGFNLEQYDIEHAPSTIDIVVEAGAGTGKTTVMIDRIMFLMHTVDGLSFEDIGMITFTNAATQNMKHKIQEKLLARFRATHSPRYAAWLEDVSKLHIQTIDSFYRAIITEIGSSVGYSNDLGLRSFQYEKKQMIYDVLNSHYHDSDHRIEGVFGMKLQGLSKLILDFWDRLETIGLTDTEIEALDWGMAADAKSKRLHTTLSRLFPELNSRYNALKLESDAISVGDIVRELKRILENEHDIVLRSPPLKYLFVDEFQDSDNAQITTLAWLWQKCGSRLFVVGDIKQSIYRFRGAVATAFEQLESAIVKRGGAKPTVYTLVRNYRTSATVLNRLDPIFKRWARAHLLEYPESLQPQKTHPGSVVLQRVAQQKYAIPNKLISVLRFAIDDCVKNAKENGRTDDDTQHVTVLVRTNFQLQLIRNICEEAGLPCYIRQEGTLFSSQAARDLFALVKAHTFPSSISDKLDLLTSSFYSDTIDLEALSHMAPASAEMGAYVDTLLEKINWAQARKEFRLYAPIAVIRRIISDSSLTENYVKFRKAELQSNDSWSEDDINVRLQVDAAQYKADLEKLMELIRKRFSGQMTSLFHIYSYLQLNLSTNRSEDEPVVSDNAGPRCVYGMTVHKAKGLEFDTIIIPFTDRPYRKDVETEILINEKVTPHKVGWSHVVWGGKHNKDVVSQTQNKYYQQCLIKEFQDIDREEARLLYVAMTRSIRRLVCLVSGKEEHSWANLLEV